ncbi:MAG: hypothetical protein EOO44_10600 [Flavobacterium sp.]|nr:MAG: hypothetical protein EOO44_10600 [Flavobacterium sp.]
MINMNKFSDFTTNNWRAIVIGLFCFGTYIYFTIAGNRICDCETTEKYRASGTARSSYNHFYHK